MNGHPIGSNEDMAKFKDRKIDTAPLNSNGYETEHPSGEVMEAQATPTPARFSPRRILQRSTGEFFHEPASQGNSILF